MKIAVILKKIARKIRAGIMRVENGLLRLLGFNNACGFKQNAIYGLYHMICRYNYRRLNGPLVTGPMVGELKESPFVVIPPGDKVHQALDAIPKDLLKKLDDPSNKTKLGYVINHLFSQEEFQNVRALITPWIDAVLKQIFKSYYIVSNAYIYRSVQSNLPPRSSFLWHFDDHPECHLKLLFYLTDTYKSNGAIQVHSWQSARNLKRRGFLDRRNVSPKIQEDLNDEERYTVIEGKRGTSFIFAANTIHRGVIPEQGHRDVIAFELLPSPNPSLQYLCPGVFEYWQNPLDLYVSVR